MIVDKKGENKRICRERGGKADDYEKKMKNEWPYRKKLENNKNR